MASLPSQRYSTNFLVSPNSVSQRKMTSLCCLHAHLLDDKVQSLSICLKATCIPFPVNFLYPCLFSCTPFTAKLLNNHLSSVPPFLLSHSLLIPSPLPHLPLAPCQVTLTLLLYPVLSPQSLRFLAQQQQLTLLFHSWLPSTSLQLVSRTPHFPAFPYTSKLLLLPDFSTLTRPIDGSL